MEADEIAGTVVYYDGTPAVGALVQVGDAIVTTDAAGHFALEAAPGPYDLTAFVPRSIDPFSDPAIFLGLVDHAPTINLLSLVASPPLPHLHERHDAKIFATFPEDDGVGLEWRIILDHLVGLDTTSNWTTISVKSANPLKRGIDLQWNGASTISGRVQAFRYSVDPVTKGPLHYVGYDSQEVTIVNGAPTTLSVSWKPPPFGESTISFDVHRSPGQGGLRALLDLQAHDSGYTLALANAVPPGAEVSFVVPDLADASYRVSTTATDEHGAVSGVELVGLAPGSKGLTVDFPPSLDLISPMQGDKFGVGSTIQWTSGSPQGTFLILQQESSASGSSLNYFIATDGDSVTLPDLTRLGIQLPVGEKYRLSVERYSVIPTVDDIAAARYQAAIPGKPRTGSYMIVPELVSQ